MRRAREYSAYLVDIEGVLVRDKRYLPIEGSIAWFNGLSARGLRACLVSNNTTHRPEDLVAELRRAGFEVSADGLVTAAEIGRRLLARWGWWRVLWLGTPSLWPWWAEAGFQAASGSDCDAVVLGVDPGLGIDRLQAALPPLLDGGAELVALHRNAFYLDEQGRRSLGPGAWAAALETISRERAVCIGKPSERIYHEALKKLGCEAEDALFISDDPVGDLVTAGRLGMGTAFVLSGKHPDHSVLERLEQEDWPDLICERPADLEQR